MIGQKTEQLVITRTFNASKETIWEMLTDARHLAHWWGPVGMQLQIIQLDLRPGGIFHYYMKGADGNEMWAIFTYREISAPDRLVFVLSFADARGHKVRAPFFGGKWPMDILQEITLQSKGNTTVLTLTAQPIDCTEEETALFTGNTESMDQGSNATFDQLEKYLEKLSTQTRS